MAEINLLDRYPRSKRPIDERGSQITPEHRAEARKFDRSYFDGDRLTGYGGFNYHERFWKETVQRFIEHYSLPPDAAILDVGCAKGFMLFDFQQALPNSKLVGVDVSQYALDNAKPEVKHLLRIASADKLPFADRSFDLVISINTIHNLELERCKQALREIQRVTRHHAFVTMDAWRNEQERQQLMKWNLTALTYMHVDDWHKVFDETGYRGDNYWFIAESA